MFSRRNIHSSIEHYFYGVVLYGAGLSLYIYSSYYAWFLHPATKDILVSMYLLYVVGAPVLFFLSRSKDISSHKPAIIFRTAWKVLLDGFKCVYGFVFRKEGHGWPGLERREKTAVLFMLVKLFYIPIMLNFLVGNYYSFSRSLAGLFSFSSIRSVTYESYVSVLALIFFVDVLFFSFGYIFEAGFLRNRVRSVEPTLSGWAVALVCYPPFNTMFNGIVGWGANDYVEFSSLNFTFAARVAVVFFLFVYLWATLSLGTKCSNLTNRGIVTGGAYRYIRHPAYISKNLAWWVTTIPVMSVSVFFSMAVWSSVYYMRAVTEERHLSLDPDYREYCRKTRYRFVPYVW